MKFNVEQTQSQSDILGGFNSGALRFADTTGQSTDETSNLTPIVFPDLSETDQAQLVARWQAIEPLTTLGHKPTDEDFQIRADQLCVNGVRFSSRTLRRLFGT